jgi:hypothetical protein
VLKLWPGTHKKKSLHGNMWIGEMCLMGSSWIIMYSGYEDPVRSSWDKARLVA